ncbi:MAG: protoglobin domain-containing protein [Leptospirales bacterium]
MKPIHAHHQEATQIARALGISPEELETRKRFLNFTPEQARLLEGLVETFQREAPPFVASLHDRLAQHPKAREILEKAPSPLWLQNRHIEYFTEMAEGKYDFDYALNRISVGLAHQKIGMEPKWFLGSFSLFLEWIIPRILEHETSPPKTNIAALMAVIKLSFLDISLALDAYFQADRSMLDLLSRVFDTDVEVVWILDTEGKILHANKTSGRIVGRPSEMLRGMTIQEVTGLPPEEAAQLFASIGNHAREHEFWEGELTVSRPDGTAFPARGTLNTVHDHSGVISHFILEFRDWTEDKKIQEELERRTEDLIRSNQDLEQFAYVASHDLQEPLRMVTSYTQLLARRYKGQLSEEADEFIGFAVDGAARMQSLINALLAYSRVGTRGRDLTTVDTQTVFEQAKENLKIAIQESQATVTNTPLPTVSGDPVQLMQLFQNLIGNALKFRGPQPPAIHVSALNEEKEWVFSVSDNGIGIAPKFWSRIFVIFQRLHSKEEYPGTGIGLAMCKKIVERHGCRIWLESEPGQGSTFFFTMKPVSSNKEKIHEQ